MATDIKVGDEVIVVKDGGGYRRPQEVCPGTVIKIARKYFTVEYRWGALNTADEFSIANGRQRAKNPEYSSHYSDHCYTPAGWEATQYRDGIEKRLREDHRVFSGNADSTLVPHRMTDGELLELVELLDRVKARRQADHD